MPTDWSKTFLCNFVVYFSRKGHGIWMHDYWIKNTSNDIFHFSVSIRAPVSANRFSRAELFHHFYPKIDSNAHLNSAFSNIRWFNRKTINAARLSIIKISIISKHLRSKLTSEICQKIRVGKFLPDWKKTCKKPAGRNGRNCFSLRIYYISRNFLRYSNCMFIRQP